MSHRLYWIGIGAVLFASSAVLYLFHYLIFKDSHHIFIYLMGDIAFLPLEVLLVGLVIEKVLERQEKAQLREKLNMLIGTFFSEVGNRLLAHLNRLIVNLNEVKAQALLKPEWTAKEFKQAINSTRRLKLNADISRLDLAELKQFLTEKREILILLLENPNLLENEDFTKLLWSVFHLMEELTTREKLAELPPLDLTHLSGDALRVYSLLVQEWLLYCRHLQTAYPYMFSLVARTHPLLDHPQATIS